VFPFRQRATPEIQKSHSAIFPTRFAIFNSINSKMMTELTYKLTVLRTVCFNGERRTKSHNTVFYLNNSKLSGGDLATVGRGHTTVTCLSSRDSNAVFSVSLSSRRAVTGADCSGSAGASARSLSAGASTSNAARTERQWGSKSNGAAANYRLGATAEPGAEAEAFGADRGSHAILGAGRIRHTPTERANARAGGIGLEDEGDGSGAG
jgi:hypothetical protein